MTLPRLQHVSGPCLFSYADKVVWKLIHGVIEVWRRISNFLGLRPNVVALLLAMIIIGGGEELWVRFVPKYLEFLHATPFVIGLYDALKTLLGAVYAYPGGILTDRWGHRRALVFFTGISIAGYLILFFVPHWGAVIGATFLFLGWTAFSLPATFSLVGKNLAPQKFGMGIAVQAMIKRVPILIGPVLGGILIDRLGFLEGMQWALAISSFLGIAAMLVQSRIFEDSRSASGGHVSLDVRSMLHHFSPDLRHLLLSDILIRFCERIPFAWVVIFAMSHAGIGAKQFGYLTSIEMATAMVCFIPVAYLSDRYGRESFVVITFIFFTLFPCFLMYADTTTGLAAAFVVRGLKEFGEPARKALIIQFSAGPHQGQLVGVYYLIRDLVVTPGAFLGAWLWQRGAAMNFWGAFSFGIAGTLYYLWVVFQRRAR